MKKLCSKAILTSLLLFCLSSVACGNKGKSTETKTDSGIIPDSTSVAKPADTIYEIKSIIIPASSKNLQVYKSPSKDAPRIIYMEDESGELAIYEWGNPSKGEVEQWDYLPILGEEEGWYKVYANRGINQFIGYVPKSDDKKATILPLKWEELKKYHSSYRSLCREVQTITRLQNTNNYVVSGEFECVGPALVVGKIEKGFVIESESLAYEYDTQTSEISIGSSENKITNPHCLTHEDDYLKALDFSKLTLDEFNTIFSSYSNDPFTVLVKIAESDDYCLIWLHSSIDGHEIKMAIER